MSLIQQTGHALGSEVLLTIDGDNNLLTELWSKIQSFELQFSRFKPASELSLFNQKAGEKTTVTPAFRTLLVAAQSMANKTSGLYNPLTLPALQQAGYVGSWPLTNNFVRELNYSDRQAVPATSLEVGDTWAKIPAKAALDFGGCGKGYLLDRLADFLDAEHVDRYWLSLGGDIVCRGGPGSKNEWQINVDSAERPGTTIDVATNPKGCRMAIATSGVTKRKGQDWHHLIDPRTNKPADTDVLTATITCPTALDADVFAKCLVILGSKAAKVFLGKQQPLAAIIQYTKNTQTIIKKYGDATS